MKEEIFKFAGIGNLSGILSSGYGDNELVALKNEHGTNLLMVACYYGHIEVIKHLLVIGADVNAKNDNGMTPLLIACDSDMPGVVELLLDAGADSNVLNIDGETTLMVACMSASSSTVNALLETGVDPTFVSQDGFTAAMYTAFNQDDVTGLNNLKLLADKKVDFEIKNKESKSLLDYASEQDKQLILNYLESKLL